jgi:hypothetical protein
MGQHADDIINGDVDEITGEWLGNGQGFPRTIHGKNDSFGKGNPIKATKNYLSRFMDKKDMYDFCVEYVKNKYPIMINVGGLGWIRIAEKVQSDFGDFVKYRQKYFPDKK